MEAEQETQEDTPYEEGSQQEEEMEQEIEQEQYIVAEEVTEKRQERKNPDNRGEDRSSFVHGLSVGLGIGCIATFVIMWISVFFTPLLPTTLTYENLISIFIYPLIYLLAVGLIALTAGIVREYFARKSSF